MASSPFFFLNFGLFFPVAGLDICGRASLFFLHFFFFFSHWYEAKDIVQYTVHAAPQLTPRGQCPMANGLTP
jgi:hypothetical protein